MHASYCEYSLIFIHCTTTFEEECSLAEGFSFTYYLGLFLDKQIKRERLPIFPVGCSILLNFSPASLHNPLP